MFALLDPLGSVLGAELPSDCTLPSEDALTRRNLLRVLPFIRKHQVGDLQQIRALEDAAKVDYDLATLRKDFFGRVGVPSGWWTCQRKASPSIDPGCATMPDGKEKDACGGVSTLSRVISSLKASF